MLLLQLFTEITHRLSKLRSIIIHKLDLFKTQTPHVLLKRLSYIWEEFGLRFLINKIIMRKFRIKFCFI